MSFEALLLIVFFIVMPLLERLMKTLKQRTRVVGVFPNRASCERLIGAVLVEQHEKWQLEERPYFSMENV